MAKVKCRSCDICGEMNAKDGFMFKTHGISQSKRYARVYNRRKIQVGKNRPLRKLL